MSILAKYLENAVELKTVSCFQLAAAAILDRVGFKNYSVVDPITTF